MKTFLFLLLLAKSILLPSYEQYEAEGGIIVYLDKLHGFSVQYPKVLEADIHSSGFIIKFHEPDGPVLFGLKKETGSFTSLHDWVESKNAGLSAEEKITVTGEEIQNGIILANLRIPVKVDQGAGQKPMYANQTAVVFLHHGNIYSFYLREQWSEPVIERQFRDVIKSFRFVSPGEDIH